VTHRWTGTPPERAAEMVQRLGVSDPEIAEAMRRIPREWFVPEEYRSDAYEDEPLPIWGRDATISAPHMVVLQLRALHVVPGNRILEVGSGSGYLLALLAELAGPTGSAIGVERYPELVVRAREALAEVGLADRARVVAGDGRRGWPEGAPYDRIAVSCAVPEIEPAWREQVAVGGRIVAPVGPPSVQRLLTIEKGAQGDRTTAGPQCRFVSIAGGVSAHI
jgi:protein-L-isoaspartate(D-aspartate) O-methyltransferase